MSILPEEYSKPIVLGHFLGKVCTVLVDRLAPFQANMTPEEATQSFTGVVNNIDNHGVCITDLTSMTRNFFFFNHIVGLREEKVLDPNDPKDQQEIALIQQAMEAKAEAEENRPQGNHKADGWDAATMTMKPVEQMESIGKESAFVNISDLQNLARKSKS